ncbi:MAG: hypothetical protein ACI845_000604 [Gammaproteobacteria bacterium]|jgi:hypothetical protein
MPLWGLPFGRGVNFQIEIEYLDQLLVMVKRHNITLFEDIESCWYLINASDEGMRQFIY